MSSGQERHPRVTRCLRWGPPGCGVFFLFFFIFTHFPKEIFLAWRHEYKIASPNGQFGKGSPMSQPAWCLSNRVSTESRGISEAMTGRVASQSLLTGSRISFSTLHRCPLLSTSLPTNPRCFKDRPSDGVMAMVI